MTEYADLMILSRTCFYCSVLQPNCITSMSCPSYFSLYPQILFLVLFFSMIISDKTLKTNKDLKLLTYPAIIILLLLAS